MSNNQVEDKLDSPCGQSGAFQLSATQWTRLERLDQHLWLVMSAVGHTLPERVSR